jgi:phage-related minor tail protein
MNEGSVDIDQGGLPSQTVNDDSHEEEVEVRDEGEEQVEVQETETQAGEEGQPQYTEKGTKLDPNPQSAVHQQLANERRLRQQFQQVLDNPEALRKYAAQLGMTVTEAKAEIKDEQQKLYTPDRFKTPEDVANALNEMAADHKKTVAELREENKRLKEGFGSFNQSRHIEHVASTMTQDISSVQAKYPELNPKSPDYDHELDFDPQTGGYKGNHSLAKIADRFMRIAGRGRERGTQAAQTNVRVKQAGRVVTSSKPASKEGSGSTDPGTVIAQRIAKAMGNG